MQIQPNTHSSKIIHPYICAVLYVYCNWSYIVLYTLLYFVRNTFANQSRVKKNHRGSVLVFDIHLGMCPYELKITNTLCIFYGAQTVISGQVFEFLKSP